jgi:hypothetical protein
MNLNPFNWVNLHGHGHFRSVTLALPIEQVRRLMPPQLALGAQTVTPEGTHPVILSFNSLYRAEMSIPSLLPPLTYSEFTLGVPYSQARRSPDGPGSGPPCYYMPRLFLDSVLATMGGILYWGYTKKLARFRSGANRIAIDGEDGSALTSLDFEPVGTPAPIDQCPNFAPIRAMLDQPLISLMPVSLGPVAVVADFDKYWPGATVQPLHTAVSVQQELVPHFGAARFPAQGRSPGIDAEVLGSYELIAPWRLGMAHMPLPGRLATL